MRDRHANGTSILIPYHHGSDGGGRGVRVNSSNPLCDYDTTGIRIESRCLPSHLGLIAPFDSEIAGSLLSAHTSMHRFGRTQSTHANPHAAPHAISALRDALRGALRSAFPFALVHNRVSRGNVHFQGATRKGPSGNHEFNASRGWDKDQRRFDRRYSTMQTLRSQGRRKVTAW